MNRRTLLAKIGASTAGITVVAGCSTEESADEENREVGGTADTSGSTATSTSEAKLELVEHSMKWDETFGASVKGILKSNAEQTLSYVEVTAYFYNNEGTRVGEGMWNANNVEPGAKVQFETIQADTGQKPAKYEAELAYNDY